MASVASERAVLRQLRKTLVAAGLNAVLAEGQADVPDQLLVDLQPDAEDRVPQMNLMFMPGMEPPVLQLYVGLPFELADGANDGLCRFIAAANVVLPVGHFGLVEGGAELIYYRYNVATSAAAFDFDATLWSMASAAYMIERTAPMIERVAGGAPWAEVVEELAAAVAADTAASEELDES